MLTHARAVDADLEFEWTESGRFNWLFEGIPRSDDPKPKKKNPLPLLLDKADLQDVTLHFQHPALLEPLGVRVPLYPLQHHEVITDAAQALTDLDFEVPTVRDPHAPSNTRQEGGGFLCGVYESDPRFWGLDGIPADFAEELLDGIGSASVEETGVDGDV